MHKLILSSHVLVQTAFVSKTALAGTAWVLSLAKCQPEHDNYDVMHVKEIKCACPEVLIQLTKVIPVREQIQWILKIDNHRIICMKECGVHLHNIKVWSSDVDSVFLISMLQLKYFLSLLVQWYHYKY